MNSEKKEIEEKVKELSIKEQNLKETKKKKKKKFKLKKVHIKMILILVIAFVIFFAGMVVYHNVTTDKEAKIITKSTLKKILDVGDLSTYEATYNGITAVSSEENAGKMDYYVSYEAEVKAGFDFEELKIDVDDERKIITLTIPEIKITDVSVKAETMDYIFTNKKANDSTVAQAAYKAARKDVKKESEKEQAIYDLAKQNAHNVMKALITPFVEQWDDKFELVIK